MDVRKLSIGHLPFLRILLIYMLGLELGSGIPWTQNLQINFIVAGFFSLIILLMLQAFGEKRVLTFSCYFVLFGLSLLCGSKNYTMGYDETANKGQFIAEVVSLASETQHQIRVEVVLKKQIKDAGVHAIRIPALALFWKDAENMQDYSSGDLIQFEGLLTPVQGPLNPQEFDYANYLKGKSIRFQVQGSAKELRLLRKSTSWSIYNTGQHIQQILAEKYKFFFQEEEVFQVIAAISIGLRTDFSKQLMKTYINTGTIHVLSVSGMHIGLLYLVLTFLLKPIDYLNHGRNMRFLLTMLFIWFYAMICGFSPAVLRATVMYSLLLYGYWKHQSIISFNLLFASAWILLIIDPDMRYDIGFQLSYLAILGIMLFVPIFQKIGYSSKKWKKSLLNLIYSAIAAQLICSPLTLYYFHQFPLYFLAANILMAIPSAVILYLSLILVLSPSQVLNEVLATCMTQLIEEIHVLLKFIEGLPFSSFEGIHFSFSMMIISYGALLAFFFSYALRYKYLFLLAQMFMLVLIVLFCFGIYQDAVYKGLIFYQVKKDIAISYIHQGEVLLVSTFDSLQHNQLQYAVMPHLNRYQQFKPWKDNQLIKLSRNQNVNELLTFGSSLKLFILNQTCQKIPEVDVLLIRNNSELDSIPYSKICILDGSNHDEYLVQLKLKMDSIKQPYYLLKDNFAYVWDR